MSLIEQFVRTAKAHTTKLAIIDRATGHRVTYKMALLRSLIREVRVTMMMGTPAFLRALTETVRDMVRMA